MSTLRLPLVEGLEQRLPGSDKDGLSSNVFFDKSSQGTVYATKRPGITSYVSGSGQAQGIFYGFIFSAPSYDWNDIVWNGTTYCAVGNFDTATSGIYGMSMTSSDGRFWTNGNFPTESRWNGVAWNGTAFCAVGYNVLSGNAPLCATSTDGRSWTTRTIPNGLWTKIASDGSRFVAVGQAGGTNNVAYSTDNGATWTAQDVGSGTGWSDIAWNAGASLFAMVGGSNSTEIRTSPTGVTWTTRTAAASARRSIVSSGTKFVSPRYDNSGKADTSTDGITWSEVTLPASAFHQFSAWTGTDFLIVSTNDILKSSDGTTWSTVDFNSYADLTTLAGNESSVVCLSINTYGLSSYNYSGDNALSFLEKPLSTTYTFTNPSGTY